MKKNLPKGGNTDSTDRLSPEQTGNATKLAGESMASLQELCLQRAELRNKYRTQSEKLDNQISIEMAKLSSIISLLNG